MLYIKLSIKNIRILYIKNFFYNSYLIRINVSLTYFYLSNGTSCYVTAMQLHFYGKRFLRHTVFFTQPSYILPNRLFKLDVQLFLRILHLFQCRY